MVFLSEPRTLAVAQEHGAVEMVRFQFDKNVLFFSVQKTNRKHFFLSVNKSVKNFVFQFQSTM